MLENKTTAEGLQRDNNLAGDWVYWLLIALVVGELFIGWNSGSVFGAEVPTETWLAVHTLLGLFIWLLAFLALSRHLVRKHPASVDLSARTRFWYRVWYALFFLLLLLAPVAGFLQLQFGITPLSIFGFRMPAWVEPDKFMASVFADVHKTLAYLLAGLIALQLAGVFREKTRQGGRAVRALVYGDGGAAAGAVPEKPPLERHVRGVQKTFGFLGWLGFWIQLWVAVITAVLLFFVTSGQYLGSSAASGNEPGIFWAKWAMVLLIVSILLTFYCRRLATREPQEAPKAAGKPSVGWRFRIKSVAGMLRAMVYVGLGGILLSVLGMATSVQLLIAKTITQPPGIAITDPNRIVRALDVFVLVCNFNLGLAHIIGFTIALWLQGRILVFRNRYAL